MSEGLTGGRSEVIPCRRGTWGLSTWWAARAEILCAGSALLVAIQISDMECHVDYVPDAPDILMQILEAGISRRTSRLTILKGIQSTSVYVRDNHQPEERRKRKENGRRETGSGDGQMTVSR